MYYVRIRSKESQMIVLVFKVRSNVVLVLQPLSGADDCTTE